MKNIKSFNQLFEENSETTTDQETDVIPSEEVTNESISDIINVITEMLNDQSMITIAGEAMEKGMALKMILSVLMGLPLVGAIATKIQNWFKEKDPKEAIKAIKRAKQGAKI